MDSNYHVGQLFVKQCSLVSELVEGVTLFKAVKMSPFTMVLALDTSTLYHSQKPYQIAPPSSPVLTLSNVNIDATLIFDHPEQKEVAYVKDKPISYKVTISENGLEATFEIKLKVLSSQLEDMNFRVKFRALDAIHGKEICPRMVTCSDPIKIISKPEKATKRPRTQGKKTTNNHTILEALNRISTGVEENLREMQLILNSVNPGATAAAAPSIPTLNDANANDTQHFPFQLDQPVNQYAVPNPTSFLASLTEQQPPSKKQKIEDDRPLDFETSFRDMMKAFESLSAETRTYQMDKFVRTHRISVTELSELHDMLSDCGLGEPIGNPYQQNPHSSMQDCNCENCPFKKQIDSRDEFMNSLFGVNYN